MGSQVLGTSNPEEIYNRLRNDPELRFDTGAEVVAAAQDAMDRARAAIPGWFGRLPQAECLMAEIPQAGAQDAPIAYYLPPATDGSWPGSYPMGDRFDIKGFHDTVLGSGPVPLGILGDLVRTWARPSERWPATELE